MAVVSMSLPDNLLAAIDEAIAQQGYKGRSEFMRAACRQLLLRERRRTNGIMDGSITVRYHHGDEVKISDVRHAFHDVIQAQLHLHRDDVCLDALVVHGDEDRIMDLADTLERLRFVDAVSGALI